MNVTGIIAEYNPLHNGHAYHIAKAREITRCDYVIAVMSGSFVQRGEPAAFDKWKRTRWALQAGADIVLELPAVYCLQSAEGFAAGGVRLLKETGVVTNLCFGSEYSEHSGHDDIQTLIEIASALDNESEEHKKVLNAHLAQGKSFPRAQSETLCAALPQYAHMLASPNFILGLEYIRALQKYAQDIRPVSVLRKGCGYNDETVDSPLSSAKAIRLALSLGAMSESVKQSLPPYVDITSSVATLQRLEGPLLYALRTIEPQKLKSIHGVSEGFEHRLLCAAQLGDLASLLECAKSKRFTMARIKRTLCCALLGITEEIISAANAPAPPFYLHMLGFVRRASPLLEKMARTASSPIVTRKAQMDDLTAAQKKLLSIDLLASDVQALAFEDAQLRVARRDYTESVVILD